MKIKILLLLVIALTLFGCSKDDPESSCNCGIIKSQGFNSWSNPGYWKFIQNDCSGISKTFYFTLGGGTSIGDPYCFAEGTSW